MKIAMEKSLSHVIVEIDCLAICTMWSQGDDLSLGGQVFREIRSYLSNFQGFSLTYVRREANVVAHQCARHALSVANFCNLDATPDFLMDATPDFLIQFFRLNE